MIAVTMMDGEEMGVRLIELTGATGANKSEHAEGFLPIVGVIVNRGTHIAQFGFDF